MRKTAHEFNKTGPVAHAANAHAMADQPPLPFFDAVMPPTMTTENSAPNDAHAAPGAAVDTQTGANGTGAESQTVEASMPSAAPEAAHEAALAADAFARR